MTSDALTFLYSLALKWVSYVGYAHLFLSSNYSLRLATREHQDLVDGMYFVTNITADRDLHCYKLAVESSVQHLSELPKGPHLRREVLEVEHLVLWRVRRHLGVFAHDCWSRREWS